MTAVWEMLGMTDWLDFLLFGLSCELSDDLHRGSGVTFRRLCGTRRMNDGGDHQSISDTPKKSYNRPQDTASSQPAQRKNRIIRIRRTERVHLHRAEYATRELEMTALPRLGPQLLAQMEHAYPMTNRYFLSLFSAFCLNQSRSRINS